MTSDEKPGAIFCQPWWLEAVAPGQWGEVEIVREGQMFARMPYVCKRRFRQQHLVMPKLTQTLGPWLRPFPGKYTKRLGEEKDLMQELIRGLPPFDYFWQNFHYSITNWIPFYWAGFEQSTRYTYVLDNLSDIESVWKSLRENIRTGIRKAQKALCVRDDLGLDTFLNLNEKTFIRQGMKLPYSRDLVTRIEEACALRNRRKIFFAEDGKGRIHAAVYIVWDPESAYYLMGGRDFDLANLEGTSLCMWNAIQYAAQVTKRFDFEGSMIEPIERFFRAFGAVQKPYFRISKTNSLPLRVFQDVGGWLKMLRRKPGE